MVAVVLTSACEVSNDPADVDGLAARSPAIRAMLDESRDFAPERSDTALSVRSFAAATEAVAPGAWSVAGSPLQIDVAPSGGTMRVRTDRSAAAIEVRALGVEGARADIEGSGVAIRSASGLHSMVFARPAGVEDLIVQRQPSQTVGYEVDLPRGWSLRKPEGFTGLVEIRDGRGRARIRLMAEAAWDATGQRVPVTARLDGRRITFEVPASAEHPVAIDPEWQDTGSPAKVRARSTATVLQDGRILVVGGLAGSDDVLSDTADVLCTTEIYDPLDRSWTGGPSIPGAGDADCTPVMDHVAVPLADGTVLIAGGANRAAKLGANQPAALRNAWRFDPRTMKFSATGDLSAGRVHHTGTLLASGKVLVAGGSDRLTPLHETQSYCPEANGERCQRCVGQPSADLYDPDTGAFTPITMPIARACHTATLLGDDSVLFIGGGSEALDLNVGLTGRPLSALSLFRDGTFEQLETELSSPRFGHVAVYRPDLDQILVALGRDEVSMIAAEKTGSVVGEVLDLGDVLSATPPAKARPVPCGETITDGTGGGGAGGGAGGADTGTGGGGGDAPAGNEDPRPCPVGRSYASAVLSRTGRAVLAGGQEVKTQGTRASAVVDSFDFERSTFEAPPPQLPSPASKPVLALLPTGKILLVGQTAPAELLDDTAWSFVGNATGELNEGRSFETVTALSDGTLLIAGGFRGLGDDVTARNTAEIFDPATGTSTKLGAVMSTGRLAHTATALPSTATRGPRVLLVGGLSTKGADRASYVATATAELYDPETQTFEPTGSMSTARAGHVTVRLASGKVLVTGGLGNDAEVLPASAEIYDPEAGTFAPLPSPGVGRINFTGTLLASGDVLLAGGFARFAPDPDPNEVLSYAEIFDHRTETFRAVPGMVVPRGFHTATTLPDGQVLIAGGTTIATTGELFDPETSSFRLTSGSQRAPRLGHASLMLPSGKVLITGGAPRQFGEDPLPDAELFDPATESFETIAAPAEGAVPRWDHQAALLNDGRVALIGGTTDSFSSVTTTVLSILSSAPSEVAAGPQLLRGPGSASPGMPYAVDGEALSSYWETSSGPYASPTSAPIAVWVPAVGAPVLGTFAPWSEEGATWTPPSTAFAGSGVLFAARHGQSSVGVGVEISLAAEGVSCSADAACASGFCSDGVCCNERCHVAGDDDRACRACSVAMGSTVDGRCEAVAEDTDPHEDCTQAPECAERFAVCGGDGACKECRCASKLDCADGYVCTAEGNCQAPPEQVPEEGCGVSTSPGRDGKLALALAALVMGGIGARRARRARRPTATHDDVDSRIKND